VAKSYATGNYINDHGHVTFQLLGKVDNIAVDYQIRSGRADYDANPVTVDAPVVGTIEAPAIQATIHKVGDLIAASTESGLRTVYEQELFSS
jgi:hypothetical protein